ncbi:hypothetical protein CEXT_803561 [Caerostris extrusa]|uniref:Uncharacterized protein n=1 Tax=Caerostris extrusa TaxID=172846 RepID=A0AAV4PNA2_CAEEX|nr:hypothetical protein CEXT_803561 [Caerostris extrusa]
MKPSESGVGEAGAFLLGRSSALSVPQQTTVGSNAKSVRQVHLPSNTKTKIKTERFYHQTNKKPQKLHPKSKDILLHKKRFTKPPEKTTVSESDSASLSPQTVLPTV